MTVRIVDVREVTKPIASPIRNAYIDFSKMTSSPVPQELQKRRLAHGVRLWQALSSSLRNP